MLTYVWLLTLHITPVKLLYSWMENTVIQHTFLKFDQNKKTDFQSKPQIKQKKPDLLNKTSSGNIGPEAVKPDPRCSWKGHSGGGCRCRRWKDGVMWGCPHAPHPIGNPPSASHAFCCCCQMNWWLVVRRVQMVSRFEATCICTPWAGECWVEQLTRLHGGVNEADVSTAAPDRCAVLCGWMDQG